uniref:Non-structural maintenance of chromosomes element 1 homolog n=2 Tax=Graphocephala atropunctata TaxID=36148 RepID=A0A1B6KW66_9HEMI
MGSRSRRNRQVDESMDVDEEPFGSRHQLMLQYLLHERMIKKVDLIRVHRDLFEGESELQSVLATITTKIKPLKMDIKQVICDLTGETYFVLFQTTGESFFPKCCIFTTSQLEFIKQIIIGIVLSTDGAVGKIQSINSCKTMSKSEAGDAIEYFVKEKIFMEVSKLGLCLSPLAVVEFEPYLRTGFDGNLLVCDLCKQLVFVGKTCDNCEQKVHLHCLDKWIKSERSECPLCHHKL